MQEIIRVVKLGEVRLLDPLKVTYMLARDKYVNLYMDNGEVFMSDETLETFVERFDRIFLRIHRNCAVSRAKVNGMVIGSGIRNHHHCEVLVGPTNCPMMVSRRYLPTVRSWAEVNGVLTWRTQSVQNADGSKESHA